MNLDRLRAAMLEEDLPAILVSDAVNVGWLTGFSGTYARVIVTPSQTRFITDSRYTLQAAEEAIGFPVVTFANPVDGDEFLGQHLQEMGVTRIGFESNSFTVDAYERLGERVGGVEWIPSGTVLPALRQVKDAGEIARIEAACRITDAAYEHIKRLIQPGVSEFDIALDLEFFIRRQGADIAFPSIVVSGERSARPHGQPSEKRLERGDFVTMDFGARLDGYNSDITRTVVVSEIGDRHREVYDQVLKAQLAAIAMMRPGVAAKDVDARSREVLDEIGLASAFGHGLGHGLGLLVHDGGRLSGASTDVLAEGQVWTVEPGVYLPGFGGVRIEDDVVVTSDGVRRLTHAPKELVALPA